MCKSPDIPPMPDPPPPPPPPAEAAPLSAKVKESTKRTGSKGTKADDAAFKKTARTGTGALRNHLNTPQPSGNGLQIARG